MPHPTHTLGPSVSLGFPSTLPVQTSSVAAKRHVSVSGGPRRWVQPRVRIEPPFLPDRLPKATRSGQLDATIAKLFYRYNGIVGPPQN
ncbi:hypothetical protein PGT21_023188 [Puccinia graminis f. sp. tritici]|uniref:Uncharacterized protein n=1 Tax=Puccinia graminis f. sp. tritici TaxID=56615 RepID=A0A5B0PN01_PUCGR|nr:hypothetical protein PGT21_023188 [Puccinia graminis f. sp. tritici]KAA1102561.1 hypothetical protein PGTUg99_016104 [Puccinia graminis f. sp. tritici]